MKSLGVVFWIIAQLMWIMSLVGYWLVGDKIDTIYSLCMAIGLMLIFGRLIDDADAKQVREKLHGK